MSKFKVAVMQNLSQVFIIEAVSRIDALEKISEAWYEGSISLDNPDICETEFTMVQEVNL